MMDGRFEAYLDVKAARMTLEKIEQRLLDAYVEEARRDAEGPLTHVVTFEGHPASLLDEPPSRPVS